MQADSHVLGSGKRQVTVLCQYSGLGPGERDKYFTLGHDDFQVPREKPSLVIQLTLGYMNLKLKREVMAGDRFECHHNTGVH